MGQGRIDWQAKHSIFGAVHVDKFDSDGVEIAFIDEGSGAPIILVHGFASNVTFNWIDPGWLRHLTRAGYRVIALDNRGHGQSEKLHDKADYGAPVMADDVLRLMDHLGLERADLMGYSMGARISAFFGLKAPDRARSLIFGGLGGNMVRGMAGTGPIANALEAETIDDVTNPTARTFRAFAEQTGGDLKALAACIRSSRDPITVEDVGKLACPVLVAVGTKDVIAGPAEALAKLIPNAQALPLEGRDHMKAVGDAAFKRGVIEFLRDRP